MEDNVVVRVTHVCASTFPVRFDWQHDALAALHQARLYVGAAVCMYEKHLELQIVIALTSDVELGLGGEAKRHRGHDALLGLKLEAGVLPLTPYIHHVVGLCGVAPQKQGHFGLIDATVLGAELHFDQAPCILHALIM